MVKVGVTGGIGSGKSYLCQIFIALGYPVYNADYEAKILTNTLPSIVNDVSELFGSNIYCRGQLDRKKVGQLVFANKQLLEKLNSIIHPAITNHFNEWIERNAHADLIFKEAAILFESGAYKQVDKILTIWASDELRIDRVCKRDGVEPEEVRRRMLNQMSQDELVKQSDFVVRNNEDDLVLPQIISILNILKEHSKTDNLYG